MSIKHSMPLAALICLAALCAGCGGAPAGQKSVPDRPALQSEELQFAAPAAGAPVAVFDTSLGEIRALLYPDEAPIAVENFTTLAEQGYYNNTLFFRSVYGFAVQGGDGTNNDGTGRASAWDSGGFQLEYSQKLRHYSGALCAAFVPDDPAAGGTGQFYFMTTLPGKVDPALLKSLPDGGYSEAAVAAYTDAGGAPYLDNTDTVFGQIISGWEVLDALACAETDTDDRPVEDVLLNKVTITEYEEP